MTEENIESFTDDYISNAEKVTNEVEIPYTYKDGIYSAEYDTEGICQCIDRQFGYCLSGADAGCAKGT